MWKVVWPGPDWVDRVGEQLEGEGVKNDASVGMERGRCSVEYLGSPNEGSSRRVRYSVFQYWTSQWQGTWGVGEGGGFILCYA